MIRQSTLDKLHEMRLSAMADAFENQCAAAATYQNLSFEDRFGMLVDREWEKRKNSKLQKLIRNAGFRYPNASVEAIEYHPDRNLDKGQMLEFSTCRYIADDHHIILKGASGNGKTYIACALGIAACRNFIKVRYIRLPDLLNELAIAHGDGTLKKVINAYQKIDLLILDELSYLSFNKYESDLLFKVLSDRSERSSTIVTTNLPFSKWTELFENTTMVSALVDRLTYRSHVLDMNGSSYRLMSTREEAAAK